MDKDQKPEVGKFANLVGWTDVDPYEIVRVISEKTIEIRSMDAELLNGDKLEFHACGFAAHCSNQSVQKYKYASNESAPVIRARLHKDGYFHSNRGRHDISDKPKKFYDYNY